MDFYEERKHLKRIKKNIEQGFSQLRKSGGAGLQIALKVGGQESEILSIYEQLLPKISKSGEAVAPLPPW